MDKNEIIKLNMARLKEISAPYNPITGEGSTSIARNWIEVEDFPIDRINIPTTMLSEELVVKLIEKGAKGTLHDINGKEVGQKELIALWLEFCRIRIRHDFEYWAKSMAIISDKGKGRDIP
ncbi:MAG: hypothetical protein IKA41_06955, partial [Bacteroidaceae bacterium]|nr:hypothetical protein [Bacteroidaceae bacterium]